MGTKYPKHGFREKDRGVRFEEALRAFHLLATSADFDEARWPRYRQKLAEFVLHGRSVEMRSTAWSENIGYSPARESDAWTFRMVNDAAQGSHLHANPLYSGVQFLYDS